LRRFQLAARLFHLPVLRLQQMRQQVYFFLSALEVVCEASLQQTAVRLPPQDGIPVHRRRSRVPGCRSGDAQQLADHRTERGLGGGRVSVA
jgi:hypothetical protein